MVDDDEDEQLVSEIRILDAGLILKLEITILELETRILVEDNEDELTC